MNGIPNNFDLLRFTFAVMVCLVHSYQLSGIAGLSFLELILSSRLAIEGFFILSGFLICMSYERSNGVREYLVKRVRRIYPGYIAVVLLCAVGLVIFSTLAAGDYFSSQWVRYLGANALFLNFLGPELPGVFTDNPVQAVNGALWTLKIEVMFYLCVPIIVWLIRKTSPTIIITLLYVGSVIYVHVLTGLAADTANPLYLKLAYQLPGQLSFFMVGVWFYYFYDVMKRYEVITVIASIFILVASTYFPLEPLRPFALAAVVMFLGTAFYLGNFGKYGDFSYGVYICHFPIIQIIMSLGWFADSPIMFLIAVLGLTLAASIALWHAVEKRFLQRDSHYIRTLDVA